MKQQRQQYSYDQSLTHLLQTHGKPATQKAREMGAALMHPRAYLQGHCSHPHGYASARVLLVLFWRRRCCCLLVLLVVSAAFWI
jgi:hypothetical protein